MSWQAIAGMAVAAVVIGGACVCGAGILPARGEGVSPSASSAVSSSPSEGEPKKETEKEIRGQDPYGAVWLARDTRGRDALATEEAPATPIRFQVLNRPVCKIDRRLFGQFMERPSWGETGPEAAVVPGTHDLQPAVLKALEQMRIPIVRFPGGTDVDYMDWRDMVDGVPGRQGGRPDSNGHQGQTVTNRFGIDEFLRLAERMGWEVILVVNFRDGLAGKRPLDEAALHAAGLVAYCNAAVGAKLPEGMTDWPALRAKNGREKPYVVKYVQLGNEIWGFEAQTKAAHTTNRNEAYADCVAAYEKAIHAVDPAARIIVDYDGGSLPIVHQRLGDKIAYVDGHFYAPWTMTTIERDGVAVPRESLKADEIWHAWVTTPKIDEGGLAVLESNMLKVAPGLGYKTVVLEWNWNGWWGRDANGREIKNMALDSSLAKGLGAAGYVHALMRRGDVVEIATQSMLVGKTWPIAAILVDPNGAKPPRPTPSGMVTALYSRHHGDRLMEMQASGVPTYAQNLRLEGIRPSPKVAMIDALATADANAVYWHAINRSFGRALEVKVDLSALGPLAEKARVYVLEGRLDDEVAIAVGEPIAWVRQEAATVKNGVATLKLPARSVVVLEVLRK